MLGTVRRRLSTHLHWLVVLVITGYASTVTAASVEVATDAALQAALSTAGPGTTILVDAGTYAGNIYLTALMGTSTAPIIIQATDPTHKPLFQGGVEAIHVTDGAYLTFRNLEFTGQQYQAMNCDDGGLPANPGHHDLIFDGLYIHDVGGATVLTNGLKFAGIDQVTITNCRISNWGSADGIDMVGCHHVSIAGCSFTDTDLGTAGGVQLKGGSEDADISGCLFMHAGLRGLQMGGSTGPIYFRPSEAVGYEASNIRAHHNIFIGCQAAVAFTGLAQGSFTYNTVFCPVTWLMRLLQENTDPGMAPSGNVTIASNLFVFTSGLQTAMNIGINTAPATCAFTGNWWWCLDQPSLSTPSLPTTEVGGTMGQDPLFVNATGGDFHLQPASGAQNVGAYAVPPSGTTTGTTSGTASGATATSGSGTASAVVGSGASNARHGCGLGSLGLMCGLLLALLRQRRLV